MSEDENKVVALDGSEVHGPGKPNPKVIKLLEATLEAARSGDVVGIVLIRKHADEGVSASFQCKPSFGMLGGITAAQEEIASRINDKET